MLTILIFIVVKNSILIGFEAFRKACAHSSYHMATPTPLITWRQSRDVERLGRRRSLWEVKIEKSELTAKLLCEEIASFDLVTELPFTVASSSGLNILSYLHSILSCEKKHFSRFSTHSTSTWREFSQFLPFPPHSLFDLYTHTANSTNILCTGTQLNCHPVKTRIRSKGAC